jgi:hypothetical protein
MSYPEPIEPRSVNLDLLQEVLEQEALEQEAEDLPLMNLLAELELEDLYTELVTVAGEAPLPIVALPIAGQNPVNGWFLALADFSIDQQLAIMEFAAQQGTVYPQGYQANIAPAIDTLLAEIDVILAEIEIEDHDNEELPEFPAAPPDHSRLANS